MNKQEAIEKIKNIGTLNIYDKVAGQQVELVIKNEALDIISQIHEPQKVVVPEFVGEWLKEHRHADTLLKVLNSAKFHGEISPSTVNDWILDNQYDFIKAWLDGYEVEKKKLYTVEIPDPNSYCNYRYLSRNDNGICIDASNDTKWKQKKRNQFTESEIKEDFEWAWQWAKEVK